MADPNRLLIRAETVKTAAAQPLHPFREKGLLQLLQGSADDLIPLQKAVNSAGDAVEQRLPHRLPSAALQQLGIDDGAGDIGTEELHHFQKAGFQRCPAQQSQSPPSRSSPRLIG
jgi:hypothetical protein